MASNTLSRALHDIGLAAWFGGSLMGAIGVNGAAQDVDDPTARARVANAAWGRWTPVNLMAIGATMIGGARLMHVNKGRMLGQQGVNKASVVKAGLMAAALGATAYSRLLGQKVMNAGDVPVEGGAKPAEETPEQVAKAQQQLRVLQWGIPALTGGVVAVNALMGEQQRPTEVAKGIARRLVPVG